MKRWWQSTKHWTNAAQSIRSFMKSRHPTLMGDKIAAFVQTAHQIVEGIDTAEQAEPAAD
jgi:hypothetical protein